MTDQLSVPADAERYRPRLFGIAYRMLGGVQDAEDAVQEAMLRWQQADHAVIREPEAWLVSVVTRLSIDRLRRASVERATYPGLWLPEPVADEELRVRAHRAWQHGEVLLVGEGEGLLLAVPGASLDAERVMQAVGRLAHAVGADPGRYLVRLRLG